MTERAFLDQRLGHRRPLQKPQKPQKPQKSTLVRSSSRATESCANAFS